MEPAQPTPTRNIPFGGVIESCINIADVHCYISSEGGCRGKTCEFYEPRNGGSYRKDFAMFSPVTGSLLDPDFNPAILGLV